MSDRSRERHREGERVSDRSRERYIGRERR